MSFSKVAIVGVGLVGGAIGLAVRRKLDLPVVGGFRRESTRNTALSLGAVTEGHMNVPDAVRGCDLVVLGTDVTQIGSIAAEAAPHLAEGATVVDIGSTKAKLVQEVEEALAERPDVAFVGCHPLAGSEKRGVAYAPEVELEGAMCILTPTDKTPRSAVDRVHNFWQSLGMHTSAMPPADHDHILARVSHAPHFAAAALALLPAAMDAPYASSGFLDTTRLASGDPGLWAAIGTHNSRQIADSLESLIHHLQDLHRIIAHENPATIRAFLEEARRAREEIVRTGSAPASPAAGGTAETAGKDRT